MKKIYANKFFWILLAFAILIILILFVKRKIDGSKGGILEGPSHENGGIKTKIKSNGEMVEVEGGEDVLTKHLNEMTDIYVCQGTPSGIASALNVKAGGAKFSEDGNCRKVK